MLNLCTLLLGCATTEECESREDCAEDASQTCLKYGCCNTTLCVANFTYIYTPPSPSPSPSPTPAEIPTSTGVPQIPTSTVAPAPETTQIMPVEQSSPIVEASPSAMASKPVMFATSSLPMEMSSEPVMASSKTKEEMMSSSVEKMKPSPSQSAGGTAVVNTLVMLSGSTADPRPPCPDSSQRVYSLGVFALLLIALLCNVF